MDKNGLYVAGAFLGGILLGGTVGYFMAKKTFEEHQQEELDEVAEYYKKKYAKKDEENEPEKADKGREKEIVKVDKPSISEMSSIVAGYNSDSSDRTNYSVSDNKLKELKKVLQKEKKETPKMIALDYSGYMELDDSENEMEFRYDTDTEKWYDWNKVEYEIENLPFDPEDVQWSDEDQCFFRDEENHCTYILEKV